MREILVLEVLRGGESNQSSCRHMKLCSSRNLRYRARIGQRVTWSLAEPDGKWRHLSALALPREPGNCGWTYVQCINKNLDGRYGCMLCIKHGVAKCAEIVFERDIWLKGKDCRCCMKE